MVFLLNILKLQLRSISTHNVHVILYTGWSIQNRILIEVTAFRVSLYECGSLLQLSKESFHQRAQNGHKNCKWILKISYYRHDIAVEIRWGGLRTMVDIPACFVDCFMFSDNVKYVFCLGTIFKWFTVYLTVYFSTLLVTLFCWLLGRVFFLPVSVSLSVFSTSLDEI